MRKYSSNLAFVDLLFNLLVGFTSLFILSFLMINPISKDGEVTPPVKAFVEIEWDEDSDRDIDLFVKGPTGNTVFYASKENGYIVLERDDLGKANDTYTLNGESITVRRNYEIVNFTDLPPGEYVINVLYFSSQGDPLSVKFNVRTLSPHLIIHSGEVENLSPRNERTLVSFVVGEDGKIIDINDDVQIPLATRRAVGP